VKAPEWETRRVQLLPIVSSYLPALHEMENGADVLETWRLRGADLTFEQYVQGLWKGVADQRLVIQKSTDQLIGLVQLYNVDLRLGHGWLSVIAHASVRGTPLGFEGAGLFIARAFDLWDLRRLYFAAVGDNAAQYSSVVRQPGCSIYGQLKLRAKVGDELVNVTIGGIDRNPWCERFARRFPLSETPRSFEAEPSKK
jgi:RimJ/RimL family protein N-acetyltransferase